MKFVVKSLSNLQPFSTPALASALILSIILLAFPNSAKATSTISIGPAFCSATLVHPRLFVTASHCINRDTNLGGPYGNRPGDPVKPLISGTAVKLFVSQTPGDIDDWHGGKAAGREAWLESSHHYQQTISSVFIDDPMLDFALIILPENLQVPAHWSPAGINTEPMSEGATIVLDAYLPKGRYLEHLIDQGIVQDPWHCEAFGGESPGDLKTGSVACSRVWTSHLVKPGNSGGAGKDSQGRLWAIVSTARTKPHVVAGKVSPIELTERSYFVPIDLIDEIYGLTDLIEDFDRNGFPSQAEMSGHLANHLANLPESDLTSYAVSGERFIQALRLRRQIQIELHEKFLAQRATRLINDSTVLTAVQVAASAVVSVMTAPGLSDVERHKRAAAILARVFFVVLTDGDDSEATLKTFLTYYLVYHTANYSEDTPAAKIFTMDFWNSVLVSIESLVDTQSQEYYPLNRIRLTDWLENGLPERGLEPLPREFFYSQTTPQGVEIITKLHDRTIWLQSESGRPATYNLYWPKPLTGDQWPQMAKAVLDIAPQTSD